MHKNYTNVYMQLLNCFNIYNSSLYLKMKTLASFYFKISDKPLNLPDIFFFELSCETIGKVKRHISARA